MILSELNSYLHSDIDNDNAELDISMKDPTMMQEIQKGSGEYSSDPPTSTAHENNPLDTLTSNSWMLNNHSTFNHSPKSVEHSYESPTTKPDIQAFSQPTRPTPALTGDVFSKIMSRIQSDQNRGSLNESQGPGEQHKTDGSTSLSVSSRGLDDLQKAEEKLKPHVREQILRKISRRDYESRYKLL